MCNRMQWNDLEAMLYIIFIYFVKFVNIIFSYANT